MLHLAVHGQVNKLNPTFKLLEGANGIAQLDPSLTINGATETPVFRYKGGDADGTNWDHWTYGEVLPIVENGANPTFNNGSPLLGTNDDSVLFNAGDYFQAGNNTLGNIGTNDMVLEVVLRMNGTNLNILGKRIGGGDFEGWELVTSADRLVLRLDVGATIVSLISAALADNTWYHAIAFINRDEGSANGGQFYVNGVASGSGSDFSGVAATVDAAVAFAIGSFDGDLAEYDEHIAYVSMWDRASWHQGGASGPTEWLAIAKERFAKLTGIYPQKAVGTALPTVTTRATTAYLDKLESDVRKIYQVGAGWLRVVDRDDSASANIKGYLSELAGENECLQSEDMATTWTVLDPGDIIGGSVVTPNKSTNTTAGIIGDSTDGIHGVTQDITVTAVSWVFSVFAKKGDKDWLYISNETVANATCYFNLATPAVGTAGAGATGFVEDWGDGWVRCSILFTGTAATHTFNVQSAHADTDNDFTGNGSTINTYFWGAMCHIGSYMTSYIPTVAAAVTRNKDKLQYKGDDGNLGGVGSNKAGTVSCKIFMEDYNFTPVAGATVADITDGASGTERVLAYVDANGDVFTLYTRSAGGDNGDVSGTTDVIDGVIHALRMTWATDAGSIYIDGTSEGTPDTAIDIGDDLDRISVGMLFNSTGQPNGVLSNLRLFKKGTQG